MRSERSVRFGFRPWFFLGCAALLTACSTSPIVNNQLPGNVLFYTMGSMQDADYFKKNVRRAQSTCGLYAPYVVWEEAEAAPSLRAKSLLRTYYPLSVRWELKDGRQFMAQDIDIAGIMKEFLVLKDIKMQWQREQRKPMIGDFDPSLVYEVHEDEVLIKWVVRLTDLSPEERGKALPIVEPYQYLVATVKGAQVTGIDFEKKVETSK